MADQSCSQPDGTIPKLPQTSDGYYRMKKSVILSALLFAVFSLLAHWPRPLDLTIRVDAADVPPLDMDSTNFLQELNQTGLRRTTKKDNFAAGLLELIVPGEWSRDPAYGPGPDGITPPVRSDGHDAGRKATLAALGIEDTREAQRFRFGDFVTAKYRFSSGYPFVFSGSSKPVVFPLAATEPTGHLVYKPWTPRQFPDVSDWLDAKQQLMGDIERISHRQQYFTYYDSPVDGSVFRALLVVSPNVRGVASLFTVRACRAIGEGKLADAQQDILTNYRLGDLLLQGYSPVEVSVGMRIHSATNHLATQWLSHPDITLADVNEFHRRLEEMPVLTMPTRPVDFGRFAWLDRIQDFRRRGFAASTNGGAGDTYRAANALFCIGDWNEVARIGNHRCDQYVEALNIADSVVRRSRIEKLTSAWSEELRRQRAGSRDLVFQPSAGIERMLFMLYGPGIENYVAVFERTRMSREVVRTFIALKRFQLENGEFPDKPDVALGGTQTSVPTDFWTNRPMRYLKTKDGVLLYGLGYSRKDHGGGLAPDSDDEVFVLGTDNRQGPLKNAEQDLLIAQLRDLGAHVDHLLPNPHKSLDQSPSVVFDGTVTDEQLTRFVELQREWAPLSREGWTFWFLRSRITDSSLEQLGRVSGLKTLLFFETDITDVGLARLKSFPDLKSLYLGQADVTDAGLVHLKGLTNLQALSLGSTQTTDAGVTDLKKSLLNCKIIK